MDITAIICTYNRYQSLKRTLDSVCELSIPSKLEWELIVVDNNSKDDTKAVVERFRRNLGLNIRYVFEEKQGLSFARNRGIQEAKGNIIAFTDDDVLVDKHWLINIFKAFNEHDVSCIGGKILPIWEKPKPNWLTRDLYKYLALLDRGEKTIYMKGPWIWGANFAVKSKAFEVYGLFDTQLGRVPGKLYAGEETFFFRRLLDNSEKILYSSKIIVKHYIPESRMTKRYFRKWKFDEGELKALRFGEYSYRNIFGIPYYIIKESVIDVIYYFFQLITFREKCFEYQLNCIYDLGLVLGRLRYKIREKIKK